MNAAALLTHRLVLVTGKGGVGKSTLSAALALAAVKLGKRTLLCELAARPVLPTMLEGLPLAHEPSRPLPDRYPLLWAAHLDAHRALQEYLKETLRLWPLVKLATENKILSRFFEAAPGVDDLSLLAALQRFESARDASGKPTYDFIVADLPASGHALSMLGVPRGALGMMRVGALAERARAIDALLHDRARTAVCVVTLPEELPVNESVQLTERLANQLALETAHVVVNGVMSEVLDDADRALIAAKPLPFEDSAARLVQAAETQSGKKQLQDARIDDLRRRVAVPITELKLLPQRGKDIVERLSEAILALGGAKV